MFEQLGSAASVLGDSLVAYVTNIAREINAWLDATGDHDALRMAFIDPAF